MAERPQRALYERRTYFLGRGILPLLFLCLKLCWLKRLYEYKKSLDINKLLMKCRCKLVFNTYAKPLDILSTHGDCSYDMRLGQLLKDIFLL